jgi:hypothetical protein
MMDVPLLSPSDMGFHSGFGKPKFWKCQENICLQLLDFDSLLILLLLKRHMHVYLLNWPNIM